MEQHLREKAFEEIVSLLSKCNDDKIIKSFLQGLLTGHEIDEITSRWELVKRLDRGVTQRQVATELGLSLCKITRGAKELKNRQSPFRHMLESFDKGDI